MNKNNMIVGMTAALLVVGGGAFYAGMKYDAVQSAAARTTARGNFANMTPEERAARGAVGGARGAGGSAFGGIVSGEVLAKDANSITVKMRDGGSRIVFVSTSTKVTKGTEGSINDVAIGGQVLVNGKTNSDGSVTGDTIQLGPAQPPVAK